MWLGSSDLFFFFNDTATTEIYTLSLHDALPISSGSASRNTSWVTGAVSPSPKSRKRNRYTMGLPSVQPRSEEHTSELQSRQYLVCRLLLEKKKSTQNHSSGLKTT